MNSLKQRIIGALVLISLAVIFLPMIFDKPHQQRESQIIAIPIPPDVPAVTFKSPVEPTYQIIDSQGNEQANIPKSDNASTQVSSSVIKKMSTKGIDLVTSKPEKKSVKSSGSTETHSTNIARRTSTLDQRTVSSPDKNKKSNLLSSPVIADMAIFKNSLMIQVGTFNNKKNALNLRQRIISMNLDGHVAVYHSDGKKMWQVFSGPYSNKQKAETIQKQLDQKFKVKTIIKPF